MVFCLYDNVNMKFEQKKETTNRGLLFLYSLALTSIPVIFLKILALKFGIAKISALSFFESLFHHSCLSDVLTFKYPPVTKYSGCFRFSFLVISFSDIQDRVFEGQHSKIFLASESSQSWYVQSEGLLNKKIRGSLVLKQPDE